MAQLVCLRIAVLLILFLIPVTLFSQPSETMPASIPDEIVADWKKLDAVTGSDYASAIKKIKAALSEEYASKVTGTSSQADYLTACHWRRVAKMKPYLKDVKKILYSKHCNMGGSIVGFLSGLPTDRDRNNWAVGSGLYILTMDSYYPKPEVLLEDAKGVIKDPCPSFDGKKVVFAWWKDGEKGGCHIYEIDVATKQTRQITKDPLDLKVGDYEPCYMPTGDIMFTSTRLYSMVNCAYNTVGNMYICNKNGEWLRKIGFDQEASFTPVMMSTGDILYSRWEYNDRTRISCSAYFTMNPDGTRQNELWGNQSDFPLMKYHGREIPNSGGKIMGIAGDHLAPYQGEIVVIDPQVSRNNFKGSENKSIKLIAPIRKAPVDPSTAMSGNSGGAIKYIFQNPWPFDTANCLVSWRPTESEKIFKIYFFNEDASRELIAWDSKMSVSQPVVMDAHRVPPLRVLQADYTKETGIFSMVDVNFGAGSAGIPVGKIKKLRVIALDYRSNYSNSQGVDGFAVNPIGRAYTSWLVKTLIGEIPVAEDGSVCFIAPANTPLYFQSVDADGRMVNTMRSWTTLMPGERFDCVGCHENKNESPPPKTPLAVTPLPLEKRLGIEGQPMSFAKVIQPILDKHCTSCHNASHKSLDLRANPKFVSAAKKTFNSSYSNLTKTQKKYVDWITQEEKAAPRTKFPVPGSGTSPMADMLIKGHNTDKNKITPEEREILFVWMDMMVPCGGTYYEGMEAADSTKYVTYLKNNRNKHIEWENTNIKAFVAAGQWENAIYHEGTAVDDNRYLDNLKAGADAAGELQIIRITGSLAVQCPGTGMISMLDMTGRTLMKLPVTVAAKNGNSQTILPLRMPAGIYIVRFSGNGMVRQRVVTCLSPRGDRL
jgi:hypothetical protein